MPYYDEQDSRSAYHAKQMLDTNGHYAAERAGIAREANERSRIEEIAIRISNINDSLCHALATLRGIHTSLYGQVPEEVAKESSITSPPGTLGKVQRSIDILERNVDEVIHFTRLLGEL